MAISKERLEELIEQEATVWAFYDEDRIEKIKLVVRMFGVSVDEYNKLHDCEPMLYSQFCGVFRDICPISWLYENKEDAEFVAKYHTSRVAKFNPPTWDIFSEEETDIVFDMKDGRMMLSHWIIGDNHIILIKTSKDDDFVFSERLTKENYYKAVEKARKIFLGEEDAKD